MMMMRYVCSILFVISLGCSQGSENPSRFQIQLPAHPDLDDKGTNLTPSSSSQQACYAINVTGAGLPTSEPMACGPELGVFSGFLPPKSTITMTVEPGQRVLDLWLYLTPDGSCPVGSAINGIKGDRLIKMGSTGVVSLQGGDQTVTLEAKFPGLQANYAKLNDLTASCFSPVDKTPQTERSLSRVMSGEVFRFTNAPIGQPNVLVGSKFRLKVKGEDL